MNCALSDPIERKKAVDSNLAAAELLSDLANKYRLLAAGDIKPHTDKANLIGLQAKSIIRMLVVEWL